MISPIAYLRPALDIPQSHQEKWDGANYPRGIKGEPIPFAARIFTVADIWDALPGVMLAIWHTVTKAADEFLDPLSAESFQWELLRGGKPVGQSISSALRQITYH